MFINVILLLVVIGLFMFSLSYLSSTISSRFRTRSRRAIYIKFAIYIGVILLSMILVIFIPVNQALEKNTDIKIGHMPNLDILAYDGWDEELVKDYLVNTQTFPIDDNQIFLEPYIRSNNYFSINILVHEVSSNTNEIVASLYQTPTIFDKYNITSNIKPYEISFNNDRLMIEATDSSLSYAFFKSPFTVSQFEKDYVQMFNDPYMSGQQLILLKVPEGIELIGDDIEEINLIYPDE